MAKKKKTSLKPVARPFATTSVPSKVVHVEEEPEVPSVADSVLGGRTPTTDTAVSKNEPQACRPSEEFDPEKVEEQSLQNLIDKYQEKTEKEIVRTVKAVEMERRFSKTFPRLELDPSFVDRVIQLLDSESAEAGKPLDESEEKAIVKLGTTYGALRRLGFSEPRVVECLKAINGVDLDEAYDWLYLHCSEEELEERKNTEPSEPHTPKTAARPSQLPLTPRTPAQFMIPSAPSTPPPTKLVSRLDANAPVFVPSPSFNLEFPPCGKTSDEDDIKARILASANSNATSSEESSDTDDPNAEYVRLKMQLTDIKRHKRQDSDTFLAKELEKRLEATKKHYFFDEKDAEVQFRAERKKTDFLALRSRLRGTADTSVDTQPAPKLEKSKPPSLKPQPSSQPESITSSDIFDEDSEGTSGGMFEILEEIPVSITNDQGVTIRLCDMTLPKHWSGRTPKTLLSETVTKMDRYAVISYYDLTGTSSRMKRAGVDIRWEGRKTGYWAMEDVGCCNDGQAEQYIATIALHALTYPSTDGFAAGTSAATGSQTFFRLLPAVFRDLWDELETKRKAIDDSINRKIWANLRSIVESKIQTPEKSNGKSDKHLPDSKSISISRPSLHNIYDTSESLRDSFRARQNGLAYQEMLVHRDQLPIAQYRDEIINTLEQSQILVLSGETGCGKSTQVPTFILEDQLSRGKPCKIYCTEPRRISAISLAQRVSRELGEPPGAVGTPSSLVGYSIRLESNTSKNTRLAFVTNGIALRMLEGGTGAGGQGTAFDDITHIIIDEVHERTIESDFLLIVLKSLLQQRTDLKIILMSATVDAEKISLFFGGCPTLHVPGRTFPVDINYLEDAVEYTHWAISENSPYARRSYDKFYHGKNRVEWSEDTLPGDDEDEDSSQQNVKLEKRYSQKTASTINLLDERLIPYDLIIRLLERICFEDTVNISYSSAVLIFMPGMGEIRRLNDILTEHPKFNSSSDFRIYPLHSTLSSENQSAVFDIPPPGIRKIVIATNIAETGITIPDITCVIDSGKHREMRFDEKRQLSRLVETFVAKSNAAQRRGRAGRVQRGLCFHLFTKLRHDTQMAEHPLPEMMRLSLSDLALRIKIMKVKLGSSIEDVLSRAMDPPASINIQRAISVLVEVRALTSSEEITPMGRLLSKLPTDVHLGKFLLVATLFNCLDPALTIAATLNSKSPFVTPFGLEEEADRTKSTFRSENSDFLTLHNAFASWRRASANPGHVHKFCRANFLSHQNLQQIEDLRQQFLGYLIDSSFIHVDRSFVKELSRARYGRNRTRFVTVPPELDKNSTNVAIVNAALSAGLYPKLLSIDPSTGQLRTVTNNQVATFHPSSVNFRRKPTDFGVNYLTYFTLMQSKKMYAWETGPVDDMALVLLSGETEFKLISNSIFIDRKIRLQVTPKTNIALKHLRNQIGTVLAHQFRGKVLVESQVLWNELAMMILGKVKVEEKEQILLMN